MNWPVFIKRSINNCYSYIATCLQCLEFPVELQFEQDRGHCMQDVMASDKHPLLQVLYHNQNMSQ